MASPETEGEGLGRVSASGRWPRPGCPGRVPAGALEPGLLEGTVSEKFGLGISDRASNGWSLGSPGPPAEVVRPPSPQG